MKRHVALLVAALALCWPAIARADVVPGISTCYYTATPATQTSAAAVPQLCDPNGGLATRVAASRFTLQASAAQTASGQTASFAVGNLRELLVLINVTAVSGTTPSMTLAIDTSSDGGTTWFLGIASGAAITAAGTQVLQLGAGATATPALFGDTIRLRWTISGTSPSFTLSAVAIGK